TTVRAQCTTGWSPAAVDVRLIDLTIRADEIPDKAPSSTGPQEGGGAGAVWGAMVVMMVVAVGAVTWFLIRRRGKKPRPLQTARELPAPAKTAVAGATSHA